MDTPTPTPALRPAIKPPIRSGEPIPQIFVDALREAGIVIEDMPPDEGKDK